MLARRAAVAGDAEWMSLRSPLNHRRGLSVFVGQPQVPLYDRVAERALRGLVIGGRLSSGSDGETGARFTAPMYSVVATLKTNGIDVQRWLEGVASGLRETCRPSARRSVAMASMVHERGTQSRPDVARTTFDVGCRYRGRDFATGGMALLRALVAAQPPCPCKGVLPVPRPVQARRRP